MASVQQLLQGSYHLPNQAEVRHPMEVSLHGNLSLAELRAGNVLVSGNASARGLAAGSKLHGLLRLSLTPLRLDYDVTLLVQPRPLRLRMHASLDWRTPLMSTSCFDGTLWTIGAEEERDHSVAIVELRYDYRRDIGRLLTFGLPKP